jgi:hypothetical protein
MRDAYCTPSTLGEPRPDGGGKILIFAGLRVKGYNVSTVNPHR